MARSVNKAILIGNLTRDPELRYTPDGQAVASFGVATNRRWTNKEGEQKEDAEFHNIVAWGKLADLCSQFMKKGRKVYLEGRLQTRSWEGKDGVTRQRTEIVLEDMVLLDPRGSTGEAAPAVTEEPVINTETEVKEVKKEKPSVKSPKGGEDISEDEIPF